MHGAVSQLRDQLAARRRQAEELLAEAHLSEHQQVTLTPNPNPKPNPNPNPNPNLTLPLPLPLPPTSASGRGC